LTFFVVLTHPGPLNLRGERMMLGRQIRAGLPACHWPHAPRTPPRRAVGVRQMGRPKRFFAAAVPVPLIYSNLGGRAAWFFRASMTRATRRKPVFQKHRRCVQSPGRAAELRLGRRRMLVGAAARASRAGFSSSGYRKSCKQAVGEIIACTTATPARRVNLRQAARTSPHAGHDRRHTP